MDGVKLFLRREISDQGLSRTFAVATWQLAINTPYAGAPKLQQPPRISPFCNRSTSRLAAMLFPSAAVVAAFGYLVSLASAHNIQLKAHSRECFHEQLHADDKMTVTFQVGDREFGGSGNLEIDFWVRRYTNWLRSGANAASRSKTRRTTCRPTSVVFPPATTPSSLTKMGGTPTASATNTGPRTPRRSLSTSTALSTFQSPRRRRIRWRRRVRTRTCHDLPGTPLTASSPPTLGTYRFGQGRAGIHRGQREDAQEHCREHQRQSQVVEHLPNSCAGW